MMRLMQLMLPTQELQFQLSTLGLAQTIRTDGATEWKHVFQPSCHSKNKFQSRSQPVFSRCNQRGYISLSPRKRSVNSSVKLPPRLLAHMRRWAAHGLARKTVVEWNGKSVESVRKGFAAAVEAAGLGVLPPV